MEFNLLQYLFDNWLISEFWVIRNFQNFLLVNHINGVWDVEEKCSSLSEISIAVFTHILVSRDRSRERHKASSSKDSSRSERSVVINPPDTPSQDSPVHNGEPLPGEPRPAAEHGEDAQVSSTEPPPSTMSELFNATSSTGPNPAAPHTTWREIK